MAVSHAYRFGVRVAGERVIQGRIVSGEEARLLHGSAEPTVVVPGPGCDLVLTKSYLEELFEQARIYEQGFGDGIAAARVGSAAYAEEYERKGKEMRGEAPRS
jgi:hypothetical protein